MIHVENAHLAIQTLNADRSPPAGNPEMIDLESEDEVTVVENTPISPASQGKAGTEIDLAAIEKNPEQISGAIGVNVRKTFFKFSKEAEP